MDIDMCDEFKQIDDAFFRYMDLKNKNGVIVEKNKEIERLKKDLKKYGMHKTGCSIGWGVDGECNCGFEQALKEK